MSDGGSALSYYGGRGEGGEGAEGGEGVGRLLEEIVERDGVLQQDPVDLLVREHSRELWVYWQGNTLGNCRSTKETIN